MNVLIIMIFNGEEMFKSTATISKKFFFHYNLR